MKRKITDDQRRRRVRRALSIRKKIEGTAERPRLAVFKSSKHIYVQVINDIDAQTIASASSVDKEARGTFAGLKKSEVAEKVGALVAERAKAKGVDGVVFDRKGWPYHGRLVALAKGARDAGLKF
ncbi:MAG: 50S ribosomal protein L18 [Deltaproteobacteria bacterium]|nr:50S ribosomal protein L18 [Deltaproteobacteria bacterium]